MTMKFTKAKLIIGFFIFLFITVFFIHEGEQKARTERKLINFRKEFHVNRIDVEMFEIKADKNTTTLTDDPIIYKLWHIVVNAKKPQYFPRKLYDLLFRVEFINTEDIVRVIIRKDYNDMNLYITFLGKRSIRLVAVDDEDIIDDLYNILKKED